MCRMGWEENNNNNNIKITWEKTKKMLEEYGRIVENKQKQLDKSATARKKITESNYLSVFFRGISR